MTTWPAPTLRAPLPAPHWLRRSKDKDNADKAIEGVALSGEAAQKSTTPAIKAAVLDVAGTPAADPEGMVKACRAAGVDMPDVPS